MVVDGDAVVVAEVGVVRGQPTLDARASFENQCAAMLFNEHGFTLEAAIQAAENLWKKMHGSRTRQPELAALGLNLAFDRADLGV